MEMHQIRYFLAVCDHGSFTRAAQFSYISQPSLTQSIKKLEDELGGELFHPRPFRLFADFARPLGGA
jgi:LysR family hydrogen peroxide-inducible transcriptional activator